VASVSTHLLLLLLLPPQLDSQALQPSRLQRAALVRTGTWDRCVRSEKPSESTTIAVVGVANVLA